MLIPWNSYKNYAEWDRTLSIDYSLPLMILLHELYRDFINLGEYTEIQEKIKKTRQLFAELINLNMVYEYNESKFRDNLNIFIQQTEVLKCTEQISIDTCNNRIPVKFIDDLF